MVLVFDPLQEKVSCPLTACSELDSASADVIPRYQTHSNPSASALSHGSHNYSRVCTSEQVDEIPGGSSLSPDTEADAQETIVDPYSSTSDGEDTPDRAVNSIQRRHAIKKPPEDSMLKLKVTHDGSVNDMEWCHGGSTRRYYSAAGQNRLQLTELAFAEHGWCVLVFITALFRQQP